MYHTQITAQGVANTFRHKILEVRSENGTISDVFHVSRAIIMPASNYYTFIKLYYSMGEKSGHTLISFKKEPLLTLMNTHTVTGHFSGIGDVTMTITNDYE